MQLVNKDNFFMVLTDWDQVRALSFKIGKYEKTIIHFHRFLIKPTYNDIINGRSDKGFLKEIEWLKNDIVRYLFKLNKSYSFIGYVSKDKYEELIDEVVDLFADYSDAAYDVAA